MPKRDARPIQMTDYLLLVNMEAAVQSIRARVSKSYKLEEDVAHKLNEDERETLEQAYGLTTETLLMVLDRMEVFSGR